LVDHDIHFRPGIGADGTETFTPRTVIYDLKGGFGTLRKLNALYELQEEAHTPQGLWWAISGACGCGTQVDTLFQEWANRRPTGGCN
jgi:hypothetical protein